MAGEDVKLNMWELSRMITSPEDFAKFLDNHLNAGGKQFAYGKSVGENLRNTHPTLQRQVVAFCLGAIYGMAGDQRTDQRNAQAIDVAIELKRQIDNGLLDWGPHL